MPQHTGSEVRAQPDQIVSARNAFLSGNSGNACSGFPQPTVGECSVLKHASLLQSPAPHGVGT